MSRQFVGILTLDVQMSINQIAMAVQHYFTAFKKIELYWSEILLMLEPVRLITK